MSTKRAIAQEIHEIYQEVNLPLKYPLKNYDALEKRILTVLTKLVAKK
jgi:hypothetical protein